MSVTRWDPMVQVERMQRELDRMFGRVESAFGRTPPSFGTWLPEVDVEQTADATVFRFDLPGVAPEHVSVGVDDHLLTVTGERHEEHEEKHEGYLTRERAVGRFERSMRLPENIMDSEIEASFKDGVLTVKVPRVAASSPRDIPITTA